MSQDIGFAVVGLGMGRHHCHAIKNAPGARLVAVCDVDEARLQPAAEKFQCKAYNDFATMLRDPEVQVVNIATPSGMHAAMGIQAAKAGKHLIVEKPADILPERVDKLLAVTKRCGVKVGCIFQSRLDPLNLAIRDAIQSGRLGRLIGIHGHLPWYRKQNYYEGPHGSWKATWAMDGGGSLMNQGVHTVDLLQWLGGPVAAVCGYYGVFAHQIEAEDQTVALLKFANGALGTLYTTTCAFPGLEQQVTIYGERGTIMKDSAALLAWKLPGEQADAEEKQMLARFGKPEQRQGVAADPMAVSSDGHTQIIADLVQAIREDRPPMIGLESARHAVEIINAIFTAARTGREVRLGGQAKRAAAKAPAKPAAKSARKRAASAKRPARAPAARRK